MYLTEQQLDDLVLILKEFLKYCTTANVHDITFTYQTKLI